MGREEYLAVPPNFSKVIFNLTALCTRNVGRRVKLLGDARCSHDRLKGDVRLTSYTGFPPPPARSYSKKVYYSPS